MKSLFLTLIFVISGFCVSAQSDEGIKFEHGSWAEVKAKAKAQEKLIFIDCYAVWCGPCKKLSNEVFPQKEVGDYFNVNFINYKVDVEKGEGIEIGKQFNVVSFPTLLFINDDDEVIHRVRGYADGPKLIEEAKKAPAIASSVSGIVKNYKDNPNDPLVVKEYLVYLIEGGDTRTNELANHYFSILPEEQYFTEENFWLINKAVKDPFAPVLVFMDENKDKFIETHGENAVNTVLHGKYYNKANLLLKDVQNGNPFNEKEFQKLIDLMTEREYAYVDDLIVVTRLKVLGYQKKWKEYMSLIEKKYDKIGRESLDYSRDIYPYLGVVALGCHDKEILEVVYNYYKNSVQSIDDFILHTYVSNWKYQEAIMKKLDRPEKLKEIQIQLSLLDMLNAEFNEARKSGMVTHKKL